ncbi:MAG: hypothetical protein QNL84_03375 [Acidimicrobiia bacterium]
MNMNLIAGKSKWELFWIPALLLNIYGLLKWSDGVTQNVWWTLSFMFILNCIIGVVGCFTAKLSRTALAWNGAAYVAANIFLGFYMLDQFKMLGWGSLGWGFGLMTFYDWNGSAHLLGNINFPKTDQLHSVYNTLSTVAFIVAAWVTLIPKKTKS